jgi:hypothetical protein
MTETLTISQALRAIKKAKGKLSELSERAKSCATFAEGEYPAFEWSSTMEAIRDTRSNLLNLQEAVAHANATTKIEVDGKKVSLAYAVRLLGEIKSEIAFLKTVPGRTQERTQELAWGVNQAGERTQISRSVISHLPEARKAAAIEAAQNRFDLLNSIAENANHTTPAPVASARS